MAIIVAPVGHCIYPTPCPSYGGSNLAYVRPTRGAVRLEGFEWDVASILQELEQVKESEWRQLNYGVNWSDTDLFVRGKNGKNRQHPMLDNSPATLKVLNGFPAPVMDMCVASLAPGGSIKEHRDISGGVAAGITRFHVPLRTHPEVSFYISGDEVKMGEGELWHLDTTYLHRVENRSDIERLHLIIDLETTPELKALLPKTDWKDRLHNVYFGLICIWKGLQLIVTNPKQFLTRVRDFVRLTIFKQSVLHPEEK